MQEFYEHGDFYSTIHDRAKEKGQTLVSWDEWNDSVKKNVETLRERGYTDDEISSATRTCMCYGPVEHRVGAQCYMTPDCCVHGSIWGIGF